MSLRGLARLALAGATAPMIITTAVASAAPLAGDWTEIEHGHPAGQSSYFQDAWSDGTDVWAAGSRQISVGGTIEWRTWVQRCSSVTERCTLQNTRDVEAAPARTFLEGVTGTSANDVWVAGYATQPFGPTAPLTEHFDGSDWTIVPTPIDHGGLHGISAASSTDVWAVGSDDRVFGRSVPLALHWDGSSWRPDRIRINGCRGFEPLMDVSATGRRPLAVGTCRSRGETHAMILGRYGDGWRRERITGIDTSALTLQTVDWTGRTAWAGGSVDGRAVTLRLRHGTWSPVPVPPEAGEVYGISGKRQKDLWAVGFLSSHGWMTMHWDGTSWALVDDPGPGVLTSVTRTADGTPWAVGNKSGLSEIQRYDGPLAR